MSTLLRFLTLGLLLSISRALNCSWPYRDILGVCLHLATKKTTYCEAQEYCTSVGGELVRGTNYLPLAGQVFSEMPSSYWVGLTDLLHESNRDRGAWRWTDGSLYPPSADLSWIGGDPGVGEDCITQCYTSGKLCDVKCNVGDNWRGVSLCQERLLPTPAHAIRSGDFKAVTIPTGLESRQYADCGECVKLIPSVSTVLRCAAFCSGEPKEWCVSFYFHKARRECRLVLYTDATVNMGDAEGWRKFVMKK